MHDNSFMGRCYHFLKFYAQGSDKTQIFDLDFKFVYHLTHLIHENSCQISNDDFTVFDMHVKKGRHSLRCLLC